MDQNEIRSNQEKVYRELYEKFQGTTMAVSSESWAHKQLRFSQISELFSDETDVNVHDVGMGLADYYNFFLETYPQKHIDYSGTEILKEYVDECRIKFPKLNFFHRDLAAEIYSDKYDYVIMSGVFHQRRSVPIKEWEGFLKRLVTNCFAMANKGIAFNVISPFVDFYQPEVYYANLSKILNFINDDLSRFFEVRHNYALYEMTIFVYKEDFIHSKFNQPEFKKYFKK